MNAKKKLSAMRRLRIIEGQIKGLGRLITQDKYCVDVINQSLAVREALISFEKLILENHLLTHVAEQFKSGEKTKAVKELLSICCFSRKN